MKDNFHCVLSAEIKFAGERSN